MDLDHCNDDILSFLNEPNINGIFNKEIFYNKEFLFKLIIECDYKNISYVPKDMLNEDFSLELFKYTNLQNIEFKYVFNFLSSCIKINNKYLIKLININNSYIKFLDDYDINIDLSIKLVTSNGYLINFLPEKIKNNKELILLSLNNINRKYAYELLRFYNNENLNNIEFRNYFKNDLDIKFKSYNYLLNSKIISYENTIPFENFKKIDFFNFLRKAKKLNDKKIINNNKLINYLLLKFDYSCILYYINQIVTNDNFKLIIKYILNNNFKIISNPCFSFLNNCLMTFIKNSCINLDLNIFLLKFFYINLRTTYFDININRFNVLSNDCFYKQSLKIKLNRDKFLDNFLIYPIKKKYHDLDYFENINLDNVNVLFNMAYIDHVDLLIQKKNFFLNKNLMNKFYYYKNKNIKINNNIHYYNLDSRNFEKFPKKIKEDFFVINLFCFHNPKIFNEIHHTFKYNKDLVIRLIKNGCKIYKYISNNLKLDPEIVSLSIKHDAELIKNENIKYFFDYIKKNYNLIKSFKQIEP